MGWAALGDGEIVSGSRQLRGGARLMGQVMRHADQIIRELILAQRPTVLAFASPFVGSRGGRPIPPDSIRPLMSILSKLEEIGDELKLRVVEVDEPEARRAFMTGVPRKSKDIKLAVMAACRLRGWPAHDNHSADALCVAAWALECEDRSTSHMTTPLFTTKRRRKAP